MSKTKAKAVLTETELLAMLTKTSLPTILVEGDDDAAVYRWIEDRLGTFSGNILPCYGRTTLISLYQKRHLFPNKQLAWLADLDMWLFSPPPPEVDGLIFTSGYSIENDLYAGSDIERLLSGEEEIRYKGILAVVCQWFAFEVEEFLAGRSSRQAASIYNNVDFSVPELKAEFIAERGYVAPPVHRATSLTENYKLHLRGKTLLDVWNWIQDQRKAGGPPRYHKKVVVDLCVKLYDENPFMQRIIDAVKRDLSANQGSHSASASA
ncbi:MAG: hypothetical protein KF777_05095 [Planctomycetaceae bacterium]|nr:hypothetical protein [Planctomycetaceae bacterium]